MHYLYYKKKRKTKYLIIAFIIVLLIIAVSLLNLNYRKTHQTVNTVESKKETNTIGKGLLKTKYTYQCEHTEFTETDIPMTYIGKTLEEIKEKNELISSASYENNVLNMEINQKVKCDKHFRVQLIDDMLTVFCEKFPDKPEKKIRINLIGLYEDEVELLKNGIEFGNKESMLEFLEDFGS